MLTIDLLDEYFKNKNFDLRVSGNGRWIDQKCTPDVVWSIADFILDYVENIQNEFTVKAIWNSEYARLTISETYSKPGTKEKTAENEYDKVFSQPLAMLCYAGIIKDISKTRIHLYVVQEREILEYIARNDVHALRFLHGYIEKVLRDSGLYPLFKKFFDNQDATSFNELKQAFVNFYHEYTPIKKDYEPKRIFTKVLNPLAFKYKKKGTERGRISRDIIKKADMMYNRDNFRDVYQDKPKGVSRRDWLAQNPNIDRRDGYFVQMMARAKKILRASILHNRDNLSELTHFMIGHNDNEPATQLHHIFPRNEYPEIMHYIENLIALTPNQHYGFAHPNNNTQMIDPAAQKILLLAKTYSIEHNLTSNLEEEIYEFDDYLTVLAVGWEDNQVLEIGENDFSDVLHCINCHYDDV